MSSHLAAGAAEKDAAIEVLDLDVVVFESVMNNDPQAIRILKKALYEKGIVGMRGIPGYQEKLFAFIEAAKMFSALPEDVKEAYAPDRSLNETFLGYERGKEKFQRPDGKWVVDDLKISYYGFVPDNLLNKWPKEMDLKNPFQNLAQLMSDAGVLVMDKIGLIGPTTGIDVEGAPRVGRLLYYAKCNDTAKDNPFWCGSHFDHGTFTALVPAFYFQDGQPIPEPQEAGLYVKTTFDGVFKKVAANDPDVMMFQVGEFGQLATNDAIRATEHRVQKAENSIERYTIALFIDVPIDTVIYSTSELTQDSRYGGKAKDPCSYRYWHEESFKRYLVK